MKKILIVLFSLVFIAPAVQARDTKHMLSIADAMNSATFKERLDPEIKLYFGTQRTSTVVKKLGEVSTSKKTNAFGKSDEEACNWVFLSTLLALQDRARKDGANAVINIASNYKHNRVVDNERFECHAGAIMAGVALVGQVARVK